MSFVADVVSTVVDTVTSIVKPPKAPEPPQLQPLPTIVTDPILAPGDPANVAAQEQRSRQAGAAARLGRGRRSNILAGAQEETEEDALRARTKLLR